MSEAWSVHKAVDARIIAEVMERREVLGRKFEERDMYRSLNEAATAYLLAYRGDFEWVHGVRAKYEQYGRLFASQAAGLCNCMYKDVQNELQQAVRKDRHEGKVAAAPSTPPAPSETPPDGLYRAVHENGREYTFTLRAGRMVAPVKPGRVFGVKFGKAKVQEETV